MRVTNGMIINTTLNGLYSNMNALNKTYGQMTTGKKIQTVSEDPIIAGRALKLTTTVLETDQYKSNVKEAESWTNVTDTALANITKILKSIREKCVEASTGTLNKENKESVKTEVEQLWKQIQQEANNTYGGRYVFSGYRTSNPLSLTQAYKVKNAPLNITNDNWVGDTSQIKEGSKLAKGSEISKGSILGKGTDVKDGFTLGIGTTVSEDDLKQIIGYDRTGADYKLNSPKTIAEGTELTVEQVKALENMTGTTILPEDYSKEKFTLETDVAINDATTLTAADFETFFGLKATETPKIEGATITGSYYTLTKSVECSSATYDFKNVVVVGAGSSFKGDITVKQNAADTGITTKLEKGSIIASSSSLEKDSTLGVGSLNPEVVGKIDNHAIEYEIGANSTIVVNTEGMDKILVNIGNVLNEISTSMDHALVDDTVKLSDLHDMFTRKLDEIDDVLKQVSKAESDLGSRINRLEYTESRLSEQRITYKNLLTSTEDIDIEEVYTKFNVQYATYQSALQATSKIITNTLADYL